MIRLRKVFAVIIIFIVITLMVSENKEYITASYPELKIGSVGGPVEELQQKLKNWGFYNGNVNGNYGWATFQAVKTYQGKHGLCSSGIADENTMIAMGLTTIVGSGATYAEGKGIGEEQLLARAINGEARGEPYEGQVAVGAVILNRARDSRFPKTVAGVIYQPGAFTAVSDGQINVPLEANSTVVKAARDALNGMDPTNGCIYYWNPVTATSKWIWSRQVLKKIGKHNFAK